MKRFLLFVFSIFLTFSIAIAQDGINYQGAATDGNGDELTNQNISIRASVLSTSANGNLEWEETHSATTDQFGLFNVVIGQGTNTTNGATATFNDLDWGSGNHFLKIEMDATGGTNYAMIGTTQMMSVPYALYAKSAGIDSAMLANMIGSSGGGMGGGCDFKFPDGLDGDPITWSLPNNDYTVPSGKNLYITHFAGVNDGEYVQIDGLEIMYHRDIQGMIIVGPGSVVSTNSTISTWSESSTFNGILVDAKVTAITWSLPNNDYTVPSGKNLYITHFAGVNDGEYVQIDGLEIMYHRDIQELIIVGPGSVVSTNSTILTWSENSIFNGYLVDENYFAGCGGGGGSSSSASAVDSAMVAGMIANAGGGGGSFGEWELIFENFSTTSNNTIKWGQSSEDGFLYLMDKGGTGNTIYIYTDENVLDTTLYSGVLDMSKRHDWRRSAWNYYETKLIPIKANSYWSMDITAGNILDLYFLPLESGGGSSTASAGSMSVSTFGDTLTMNGQSIIVAGISFQNYVPTFGSVTDINGNIYQTTTINGKEWMIEDLLVTSFSNGDPLNQITGTNNWNSSTCTNPGYIINNSFANLGTKVYYNYYVIQDSRNICPSGWHVATEQDYIDVLNLFDNMTSSTTSYGSQWENAGPAFKKQNAGWTSINYPAGLSINSTYLGFESFSHISCTNANSFGGAGNTTHYSWTGTIWGVNGGNLSFVLDNNVDEVDFEESSGDTMLPCRCVKD